uniref:Uncharacterized protein n=2 Tax=Ciona intestinalis TaxID=7719 RepID=H2XYQ7_CIOIN
MTSSIRETSQAVNAIKTMTSQKMRSFYKCKNNKTISSDLLCNGNDDCGDVSASDECECTDTIYCLTSGKCTINASTCEENTKKCDLDSEFRCSNGDCLPKNVLCDKVVNCSDKSDETGCSYTYCSSNGIEISVDQICNGVMDCPDNSDECECDGN